MAFANGARRGMHWLTPEVGGLVRQILGVPDEVIRTNVPQRPELWAEMCGWYRFSAQLTDPGKLALGAGAEVFVRGGRLMIRFLSPIPALYRGFLLDPDDDTDPFVFRIEFPWFGMSTGRVVFTRVPGGGRRRSTSTLARRRFRSNRRRPTRSCGPPRAGLPPWARWPWPAQPSPSIGSMRHG